MARSATDLWSAKGKKITHLNMRKDAPTDEEITKLMIGPSGNLRAPTFRRGKKIFVGFHEQELENFLG
jgi:arsenate reductase-like glutaredoxin family protein